MAINIGPSEHPSQAGHGIRDLALSLRSPSWTSKALGPPALHWAPPLTVSWVSARYSGSQEQVQKRLRRRVSGIRIQTQASLPFPLGLSLDPATGTEMEWLTLKLRVHHPALEEI